MQVKSTGLMAACALLFLALPAYPGVIQLGDWQQFSFTDAGTPAAGCDPADPLGAFCLSSSGTPSSFLDAPPWTFSSAKGIFLSVTDAFDSGDQFEIFDFGTSIGITSAFAPNVNCGDDPAVCLATAGMSSAIFLLGSGDHSITIIPTVSAGGGSAFFQASNVPEPGTTALLGAGLALFCVMRSKRRKETN